MPKAKRTHLLTEREEEVLALIRGGLTNEQIAQRLSISPAGAKYHVSEIISKLGVASRQEASSFRPRRLSQPWSFFGLPLFAKAVAATLVITAIGGAALVVFGVGNGSTDEEIPDPSDRTVLPSTTPQYFTFEGGSMEPTFVDGDRVEVLPFDRPVANGDIIVFAAPTAPDRDFAKRVIGTPGDTVQIDPGTGEVAVDGKVISEPYIQGATSCGESCTYEVPEAGSPEAHDRCGSDECYFVMGDNRQNSSDSRLGWLVPAENIIGWIDEP